MTRRSGVVAAVAALSMIAAACGGSGGSSSDGGGETPAVTTLAAEPAATPAPAPTEAPVVTEATPEATEPPATEPPVTEPPAEEPTASDIGITPDTIKIGVMVSDLEAVRKAGISIPETLTTEHLFDRWGVIFEKINEAGGINGRTIEGVQLTWDPLNPATQDDMCAEATVNQEVFAVVNGTGVNGTTWDCLLDGGQLGFYGDVLSSKQLDTGQIISLVPPAEVTAGAGVAGLVASGAIQAGAKIGIMHSNDPTNKAAGEAAKAAVEAAGMTAEMVEINTLAGDNAASNQESGAAVGTFAAASVNHALVLTPFIVNNGFWSAVAADGNKLPFTLLDTASSQCAAFGASRAAAEAVGSTCVAASDGGVIAGQGLRADTEFEAACRAAADEAFEAYYGGKSSPGVPAGQKLVDSEGTELYSDYAPQECTLANIVAMGLTNAGINPTRASVYEAILGLGEVPLASVSNGEGMFADGKPYAATKLHTMVLTNADDKTPKGADGTYGGCPAPVKCWVATSDWFAIES